MSWSRARIHKDKKPGQVETGIAFFVGPDPTSESTEQSPIFDMQLGVGALQMIGDMLKAIHRASAITGLPILPPIGSHLRPRLALGRLAMHFAMVGGTVFVIEDPLQQDEPVWEHLVQVGISSALYAPMLPAALPESTCLKAYFSASTSRAGVPSARELRHNRKTVAAREN